jgi:alcohol dehydrogenase, propanol-preferring
VRAARFYGPNQPLRVEELELPPLSSDEVRVRVRAAGVCGTELHFLDGLYPPAKVPMVLGHEVAGEVVEAGSAVRDMEPGARVAVFYYLFCRHCRWCRAGLQQLCGDLRGLFAFMSDGGFAEYVTVPWYCLVPLPPELAFVQAAPLCCSAGTAIHATAQSGLRLGEVAVVVGAGGVGLSLIQVAKLQGAPVLAVARSPRKLAAARDLGADAAAAPSEAEVALWELTGGLGADVVFDCVGSEQTMALATRMLGKRGRLVLVGYTEAMLRISPLSLVVAEQQIRASVGNTLAELVQAVDLAAGGQLRSVVDQVVPLEEINTALGRLHDGDVVGRLVVTP